MDESDELAALLAAVARRERRAIDKLYDRTAAKLFGIVIRVLRDRGRAEDALQDAYVKIWQNAARFDPAGARPMTWLITVARNAAIDAARRRREVAGGDAEAALLPDPGLSPEARTIAGDEARRLKDCLDELPSDRRDALTGAYLDGRSYVELADHHGVPLNTMRTWLRRAILHVKACMEP